MKRALVTGASGFIGTHLIDALARRGVETIAVMHASSLQQSGPLLGPARIVSAEDLQRVPLDAGDVVFHLATVFRVRHSREDIAKMVDCNVTFGAEVAQVAAQSGARLINVGTAWQRYSGAGYEPLNLYAATKQALDDLLVYFRDVEGLLTTTVELPDTYGPFDRRGKLVSALFRACKTGEVLPMSSGVQMLDLLYVQDVVSGLLSVGAAETMQVRYSLSSDSPVAIRSLVELINTVTDRQSPVEWGVLPDRPRAVSMNWATLPRPPHWSVTPLADGLEETWQAEYS